MGLFSKKKDDKKKSVVAAEAAPKSAPAKEPASAKAPAKKAAAKTATRAPAAVRVANESAKKPAGKPFFVAGKEDVKSAMEAAQREADYEILKNNAKAVGKYEFELQVDGYHFYLSANNGQMLFDSPSFTTLMGALGGIKTFKKAVTGGEFEIKADKYGRYRFILDRKYYGENYDTRDRCVKCIESVKKFACNAKILDYTPDKAALAAFENAKKVKRAPEDVDWNAVKRAEETAKKMGKFEIDREDATHYCFYLIANNGQVLYASRYYTEEAAARRGIESFKRAAYVGNFFVDRDKFGNYRFVLKNIGSAPNFIGESYDNRDQCEKIIASVKNFIVTASIEVEDLENAEK